MKLNLLQLTVLAAAVLVLSSCDAQRPDKISLIDSASAEIVPSYGSVLDIEGNAVDVMATGGRSGVIFKGEWDLTGYNTLRFRVHNMDEVCPLQFVVQMQNRFINAGINGRTEEGTMTDRMNVDAGEARTFEIGFPPALEHPEVDDCFAGMRNTPYSIGEHYSYRVDISKIAVFKFMGIRHTADMHYVISDIEILPGKRTKPASWMAMDKDEFFPFIDIYGQFKHKDWPGKIHNDKDLQAARIKEEKDLAAHPGADGWGKFGGWLDGPKLEATGHFRVEKAGGKWWMVDPEGYLFWSHGVVRVTTSSGITPLDDRSCYFDGLPAENDDFARFYYTHDALLKPYYTARNIESTYDFSSANAYRKYGEEYRTVYADLAHKRLKSWGLNTIANSSDRDICLMDRTAYTDRIEISSPVIEGTTGSWWKFMDPFNVEFAESVCSQLTARKDQLDDPWCLGFFVDNEIRWGDTKYLADCTVKAPESQMAKVAMVEWLKGKYSSIAVLNKVWGGRFDSWAALLGNREKVPAGAEEDLMEFNKLIIRQYFSTVRRVFKEVAPGKLYLGCRFSNFNPDVLAIAGEYCDVISYNIYWLDLKTFELPEGIDKPVMIGEFHFGAMDRGLFHPGQVYTENQKDRAQRYYNYVESALRHPQIIGTHWHQFSDQAATGRFDGENFQVGFTDICDTPYYETIEKIRAAGYNMYRIRSEAGNAEK